MSNSMVHPNPRPDRSPHHLPRLTRLTGGGVKRFQFDTAVGHRADDRQCRGHADHHADRGVIDATNHKRAWVSIPGIPVVAASAITLLSHHFWAAAASQIATSVAGAATVRAVPGITLGTVKQKGFNRQNGRNQALNHGGTILVAAMVEGL